MTPEQQRQFELVRSNASIIDIKLKEEALREIKEIEAEIAELQKNKMDQLEKFQHHVAYHNIEFLAGMVQISHLNDADESNPVSSPLSAETVEKERTAIIFTWDALILRKLRERQLAEIKIDMSRLQLFREICCIWTTEDALTEKQATFLAELAS